MPVFNSSFSFSGSYWVFMVCTQSFAAALSGETSDRCGLFVMDT
jgi:hypothetical protein